MLPTLSRPRTVDALAAPISAFESETYDVIQQTTPRTEHLILYAVVGMLVLTIVLMSVVKVDRVVQSSGRVIPEGGSLFVQPLDKAIVSSILVHPGDLVRKGATLAMLDPTFATADFNQLKQKMASDQALVARLEAEQVGRPYVVSNAADPDQQLQHSIWLQRRGEFEQSVNDFNARIASSESLQHKAEQDATNDNQHLALTSQLAEMQQNLTKKGWGSQALVISSTDTRVQAQRQLEESRNSANQAQHDLAALRAQRADYINKWNGDLGVSLVTARNDLHDAEQTFAKASKVHDLDRLVAPQDAVVLNIGNASVGSVIDPVSSQSPLFTLTPLSGPLEADINVDARDVGFIRVGDPVKLKFDAFTFIRHGTADGVVKSISDGSFTTTDGGQPRTPYFKVRVAIKKTDLRNVPKDFRLIPGMTLEGDVLIGGRTIMSYLIEGGLRTGSEAMREP